ncbi:MAG: phosphoribosylanthranilate isomerase, partial [Kiritimatiellae bacterium]|nr:phosphoribosylanthranilate isomerase [Kiritimatiellia bacterium]
IVQLHGDYGADDVAALKAHGFEVWRLAPPDDADFAGEDAVLLDGRKGAQRGGTGRLADW